MTTTRADLIRDLKERLRAWEGTEQRTAGEAICSTGLPELDRLLPRGGLGRGAILEWLSAGDGAGAAPLVLALAARVQEQGGAIVVIDERREFYPPAAAALGLDLERMVVVQPANARAALWALEESLRCPAAGVVLGWCDSLGDRAFRRLQLAAEAGAGLGLLLRPARCRSEPSWAEARLLVSSRHIPHTAAAAPCLHRRLCVEVLHCRGAFGGAAINLELHHEAGHVHLAPVVADPAPPRRARA